MSTHPYPVASGTGLAEWESDLVAMAQPVRYVQFDKIQCSWCSDQATWKIVTLDQADYACTMHGTEWFPEIFPESDVTPIESIIREIQTRVQVDLVKRTNATQVPEWELAERRVNGKGRSRWPWYPIVGHRNGLRANDPVSLASAFFVLSMEGGTAHQGQLVRAPWEANRD